MKITIHLFHSTIITHLIVGSWTFANNPLWTLEGSKAYIQEIRGATDYVSTWIGEVTVKRISLGIIVRLVSPILLLAILACLSFWMAEIKRIDVTITLLLSVSALYVVLLDNIPLVGYLTRLDYFAFQVSSFSFSHLLLFDYYSYYSF